MTGHHVDAEQVAGVEHVATTGPVRGAGALPGVAAVEQQRTPWPRLVAQPFDQRGQMGEAADLAVTACRLGEIEIGKGVRQPPTGLKPCPLQQILADQVRQTAARRADADVDVRLAEIHRL